MSFLIHLAAIARKRANPFVGPLDAYTANLAGAWSAARRLLSAYTGPLIRVRRSSDDAETDIGYSALGVLDTATLLTFCGSASGFVRTVYDQNAAHGHDQGQTVALNQARLVNAGTLEVGTGGKPMANFTTAGMFLNASGAPAITPNATALTVINGVAASGRFAGSGNAFQRNELVYQSGIYFANATFLGNSTGIAGTGTGAVAWKMAGAADRSWQLDGGAEVADNGGTLSDTFGVSGWFVDNVGGGPVGIGTGKMSELITYATTLSEADVQAIQATQGGMS